jgi:hypothetical protein
VEPADNPKPPKLRSALDQSLALQVIEYRANGARSARTVPYEESSYDASSARANLTISNPKIATRLRVDEASCEVCLAVVSVYWSGGTGHLARRRALNEMSVVLPTLLAVPLTVELPE